MLFKTIVTEFGEFNINENDIIHFENGLYGFEDVHEYVLINHDDHGAIMTLQPVQGSVPQFVLLDPFTVVHSYAPRLSKADLKLCGGLEGEELKYLVIAVVKENYLETVVNLKSPIVLNPITHNARQVIVENEDYSMQHPVFDKKGGV